MTISLAVPDILVARAKSGDLEALEALYRAFETPVYNLALRVLRRPEDAEDVLQETFLEVVRSIRSFRGEGHLWSWIRQIASSKALMRIRRHQVRAEEAFDEEATAGSPPVGVPARVDLERAFERLSETSRAVVWFHDVEGYTHEEIEELLALRANEGSVWARQHLEACPACRAELEALYQRVAQLKALPALGPARDRWPVIRDHLAAQQLRRRRWAAWGLAAAAAVIGVIVLRPFGGEQAYGDELAQAKRQSASLEAQLQRYDPDSRVETGRAAALAAELE